MIRLWISTVLAVTFAATIAAVAPARATDYDTEKLRLRVEIVAAGLDHPWGLAFLPDGSMLVTERSGKLWRIIGASRHEVTGVPPVAGFGQGGLLDISADSDFAANRRIYFTYAEPGPGGASTALAAAILSANGNRLEDLKRLWVMAKKTRSPLQFGSRIVEAPDGTLFVTVGDRGNADRAQDFFDSAGSVIHLNRDGSIPPDNPFADGKKGLPELWSKGHRNPQGAVWDIARDKLWIVEHGAMGGDEINAPQAGKNYGWPVISYGVNYDGTKIGVGTATPGFEQPVYYWDPSIAPSGMAVVTGDQFAAWKGDLLVGALKYQMLVRLEIGDDKVTHEERMLQGEYGRIRDIVQSPDGAIYLLTDEDDGQLLRLTPAE